jgi:predicted hydrocarbon binding protein
MDLKKLLLNGGQRTNIKKGLVKTNNIGKNPLRENYKNKQLIKEDKTNKKYELRISNNVSGYAILKFDLPSGLKITSSNGKITIGSGADKFTYDCGKEYFTYVGTRSGGGRSTYTNNDLSKFIENKYCKTDVGGGNKPTNTNNK